MCGRILSAAARKSISSGSVPELAAADDAPRPLEHDAEARRQELFRLLVGDPAILVMLGAAEFLRDWQLDFHFLGLAEVVARDLVAGVGQRLPVLLAEGEIDAGQPSLFIELALCGGELVLAGIDQALGKVPVVVGAQDEEVESAAGAAEHDHAGRARRRLALHRRMLQKNRGLTAPRCYSG